MQFILKNIFVAYGGDTKTKKVLLPGTFKHKSKTELNLI